MDFSKKSGKTVAEAVALALKDLNAREEDVSIEVLTQPTRGFLGIGAKLAEVSVTIIATADKKAIDFLETLFEKMNVKATFEVEMKDDTLYVNIVGDDLGVIIGKRGQTLDSIQYLVSLAVNKEKHDYVRIILNAENYREKREKTLIELANKLAKKVKITRKDVILEPMNPYERRIIHAALQNNRYITTRSEGDEPYRRVIIKLKKA